MRARRLRVSVLAVAALGLPGFLQAGEFLPGDVNVDGIVDVSDAGYLTRWLLNNGPVPACMDAANVSGDDRLDVRDVVDIVAHLVLQAGPPLLVGGSHGCKSYSPAPPPQIAETTLAFLCSGPVAGTPGTEKTVTVFATLSTQKNTAGVGPEGWSMAIGVEDLTILEVALTGTDAEHVFKRFSVFWREVAGAPGAQGDRAVFAAVNDVALPPEGTATVAAITVRGIVGPDGLLPGRLFYTEDVEVAGQPFRNVVSILGTSQTPSLQSLDLPTCGTPEPPCASGPDCNENKVCDDLDILSGTSEDSDLDGIPDSCEKTVGSSPFVFGFCGPCGARRGNEAVSVDCTITTETGQSPGAEAWSLGFIAEGADVTGISIAGTVAAGLLSGGFQSTSLATLVDPETQEVLARGAVSTVMLSFAPSPPVLPEGSASVARLTLTPVLPEGGGSGSVRLFYHDGLRGAGDPVTTSVVLASAAAVRPTAASCAFEVSGSCVAPDCNGNGRCDELDILSGESADSDLDGVPDGCETEVGTSPYAFGFSGPCGEVMQGETISVDCTITREVGQSPGAYGWQLGFIAEGAEVTGISTAGTDAAGLLSGGFNQSALATLVDPVTQEVLGRGAVSTVVLSLAPSPPVLPEGTSSVARLTLEPSTGASCRCVSVKLFYHDQMLRETGVPLIDNQVGLTDETMVKPTAESCAFVFCGPGLLPPLTCDEMAPGVSECSTPPSEEPVTLVAAAGEMEITFPSVTAGGSTTVTTSACDLMAPEGFVLPLPDPVCYDIETTATFAGEVELCVHYDDTGLSEEDENALLLLSCESGMPPCEELPVVSRDVSANILCATTTHFSLFTLALDLDPAAPRFRRGDCNGDGQVTGVVTDAVFLLGFNFLGTDPPQCLAACDVNGDGQVRGLVTDAVYLLTFNFLGTSPPPGPFPGCGTGLASDRELGCEDSTKNCGGGA
jgi:hypothetical protein